MTTLEVLKAARDKVRRGWCQKSSAKLRGVSVPYNHDADSYCVWGACRAADIPNGLSQAVCGASDALYRAGSLFAIGLVEWNDAPGRTQAEVIELFDKAIAAEEAKCSSPA